MKYFEFKNAISRFLFFSTHISYMGILRVQLSNWEKKGLIIRLKRGLYVLNENNRKIEPSRIFLANSLYSHSYVSTAYALGYYDLIPEKVEDGTQSFL